MRRIKSRHPWLAVKKILVSTIAIITLAALALYLINPKEIYQLTETTARFIDFQPVPKGLDTLKAEECGRCHEAIYHEWQGSLHAKAFTDPFFQAYHRKDKGDPTCLVCHSPLQNQSPVILTSASGNFDDLEVIENPDYDPELQQEGVTCSACHVRDGIIYGPYQADTMNAPHPVAYDEDFLRPALCNRCHEVPSKNFSLMDAGLCSTSEEYQQGPWPQRGTTCQHCHMPAVTRPLAEGFPPRAGRKHLWPGGYSTAQLASVFSFDATRQGDEVIIGITNSGAGHKVPTGDPDRFMVLEFLWVDDAGKHSPVASIQFKRQIVWQPIMFVWSDNRPAPGQRITLSGPMPDTPGRLVVNADYHVMTERQLERLKNRFGLVNPWPIRLNFLSQIEIPMTAEEVIPISR